MGIFHPMPIYRCIFRTRIFTTGGVDSREEQVFAPDDRTAIAVAKSRLQNPGQTVEIWEGARRVDWDAGAAPAAKPPPSA